METTWVKCIAKENICCINKYLFSLLDFRHVIQYLILLPTELVEVFYIMQNIKPIALIKKSHYVLFFSESRFFCVCEKETHTEKEIAIRIASLE